MSKRGPRFVKIPDMLVVYFELISRGRLLGRDEELGLASRGRKVGPQIHERLID